MSSDKPAFAQSLVAMYGSSSESSEDEDSENIPFQDPKGTSHNDLSASENPDIAPSGKEDIKEVHSPMKDAIVSSKNFADDEETSPTPPQGSSGSGIIKLDTDEEKCESLSCTESSPLTECQAAEKVENILEGDEEEVLKEGSEIETESSNFEEEDPLVPEKVPVGSLDVIAPVAGETQESCENFTNPDEPLPVDGSSVELNIPHAPSHDANSSSVNFSAPSETSDHSSDGSAGFQDALMNSSDREDLKEMSDVHEDTPEQAPCEDSEAGLVQSTSEVLTSTDESSTSDFIADGTGKQPDSMFDDEQIASSEVGDKSALASDSNVTQSTSFKKSLKGKGIYMDQKKKCPSPGKNLVGRRLRQIRHPSAKAAEAAADAAFVAAVTPTRKNLKEAKIACAIANVADSAETLPKKTASSQSATKAKKSRSSGLEQFASHIDSRTSPVSFSEKEDSSSSDRSSENSSLREGKLTSCVEDMTSSSENIAEYTEDLPPSRVASSTEGDKPIGIKLKISRESVQILDPMMSKLEVQIPSEPTLEVAPSPGSLKKSKKMKEGTPSPIAPMSPITLKIAKSKEGLGVVSTENSSVDSEVGKIEKITLKLSKEEGAVIVKSNVEENLDSRPEKLTLKLTKDEGSSVHKSSFLHPQDDVEETKLEKITLKLSKGDSACIVKKKECEPVSSSSDNDSGKLERITLKLSTDNNVSIVRPKDSSSLIERCSSASPEPGKIEKITLKVSKNDNVSIVKPSSPLPFSSSGGVEKLTLKVSKDGTAAVSGKQYDEPVRDVESSKLEKITLKLSKDDGVSIVKPASPVLDRKALKSKDEPLSPLSPLIISRTEDSEPHKERITLKLSKAGGHPSPVGIVDERSSWSIKSTDSDTVPSPVASDPATPKSKPKRALSDTPEAMPSSVKRLKLSEAEKSEDSSALSVMEVQESEEHKESSAEDKVNVSLPVTVELKPTLQRPGVENTEVAALNPRTEDSMEVVTLESEDSQGGPPASDLGTSAPGFDELSLISPSKGGRRKPRGRPRKAVLTPGAVPIEAPVNPEGEPVLTTKAKREKLRPEPTESDRPKRVCKGREKPPPKPVKPAKPRGRSAMAKQKAEQSIQPEGPQLFEEETRMSADCGSQSQSTASNPVQTVSGNATNGLIAKVVLPKLSTSQCPSLPTTPVETPAPSPGLVITNEESQGSMSMVSSTTESTQCRGNRKGRMEINVDPDAQAEFTVDMIAEYSWPLNDGHAETYMIQEQISAYLGVKSFKRKYPTMQRRTVDHDERQYLLERKLVSESLCDLGLTALPSYEVLDVLCTDFPEKYEEYCRYLREKVQRELSNKQKALLSGVVSGKEDPKSKAMRNMASFNALLNRSRREQRRACFDLQSFTVHYPEQRRGRMSVPNLPPVGPYPLALVSGQYTDYYKEYTPQELRYFPLNTVLYGPLLPHEMMRSQVTGGSDGSQSDSSDSSSTDSSSSDSDSSGSDSDSDSDSSSGSEDDSSDPIGIAPVENHESEVDRPDAICRVCNGDKLKNKLGNAEPLVHCASCEKSGHLSCLDLTVDMFPHIRKYSWHCTDCKLCAQCNDTADEDKMLFCDMCDRGYHIYCVGLRKVPEGRWHCQECALCASCGARDPGGSEEHQATVTPAPQDTPSKLDTPQWQHEFKKGNKGTRIYVRTLCVPCSKLWRKGRYCRLCWKCYSNQPEDEGLINCSICDRWMHADCCKKAGRVIDTDKISSYICELCQLKGGRVQLTKLPAKLCR